MFVLVNELALHEAERASGVNNKGTIGPGRLVGQHISTDRQPDAWRGDRTGRQASASRERAAESEAQAGRKADNGTSPRFPVDESKHRSQSKKNEEEEPRVRGRR